MIVNTKWCKIVDTILGCAETDLARCSSLGLRPTGLGGLGVVWLPEDGGWRGGVLAKGISTLKLEGDPAKV